MFILILFDFYQKIMMTARISLKADALTSNISKFINFTANDQCVVTIILTTNISIDTRIFLENALKPSASNLQHNCLVDMKCFNMKIRQKRLNLTG